MKRDPRRSARRRGQGLAALTTVLLAACTGGARSVPTTTPIAVRSTDPAPTVDDSALPRLDDVATPAWKPTTRTDELELTLGEGRPTVQQAIDAFSLTYLPMPGATPSPLPDGGGIGANTALRLIESARGQLAPEQLAVLDRLDADVQAWVSVPVPDSTGTAPSTTVASAGLRKAPRPQIDPVVVTYLPLLQKAFRDWHLFRPELPQRTLELVIEQTQLKADVDMDTKYPADSASNDGSTVCRIRVFPHLWEKEQPDQVILTSFAHELFHCAQGVWNPAAGFPDWLTEGSAHFAAFDLYRAVSAPPERYSNLAWFNLATDPLAGRSYDAWPLFESYLQYGGDPYAAVQKAFEGGAAELASTGEKTAAWLQLAGLDSQYFRSFWSTNALRSTSFAEQEWMMKWPHQADLGPRDQLSFMGTRDVGAYSVTGSENFSHDQQRLKMGPEVGLVILRPTTGPLFTHSTSGTHAVAEGATLKLCFEVGGCKCPSDLTSDAFDMNTRDLVFSFAAQEGKGAAEVIALPWDAKKLCEKPVKKSAEHNGDPHLRSFDGQAFDVMAPGEFVAARDDRGGFEVQVRNQVVNHRGTGTSVVALGAATHRIVFAADLAAPAADITVAVDGKSVDPSAAGADASVKVKRMDESTWIATWPDGSFVRLHWNRGWFVSVALDASRAPHVTGLLGTPDNDVRNDLEMPDGTRVDPGDRKALDLEYAPRWYVEQKASLFDYRPGETTVTFRVTPPPPPTIDIKVVQACRAGMSSAATEAEVDACAYDVAATGDDSFVVAYSQVVTGRLAADPTSAQIGTTVIKPTGGPSASGSSITLSGTLASGVNGATGVVDQLTGTIEVKDGSIILGQAQLCAPGRDVVMRATLRGTNRYSDVHLCDPLHFNVKSHDTDEVVPGEGALWASKGGTYDIRVATDSDQPLVTNVKVSTDPSPTVVDATTLATKGYRGRLSGRGDTVVLLVSTGDRSVTWKATGMGKVCGDALYGSDPIGGGGLEGIGVCAHTDVIGGTPTGDLTVQFIIYAHTDDAVDITFLPQPAG